MRRLLGIITSAVLISGLITIAGPANAGTTTFTLDDCGNTLKNRVFSVPAGDDLQVDFTTCAQLRIATTNPASFDATVVIGMTEISTFATAVAASSQQRLTGFGSGPGVPLPSSQFHTIYFVNNTNLASQPAFGSFSVVVRAGGGGGGSGGGSSSSSPASAPTVETLQVGVSGSDTTCTGGNPTGFSGSWLQLPSAGDCQQTGPKAIPNAKLLGWATDPNFPVAIAQRQVNNGWGAYETFNAEGAMTGVFIPAGGSTFISGSNTLYPIWSS